MIVVPRFEAQLYVFLLYSDDKLQPLYEYGSKDFMPDSNVLFTRTELEFVSDIFK